MNILNDKTGFDQGFTHGGVFHADDVFSTAFLQLLNPDIRISRGNLVPDGFNGIVFDIGGGQFDHHQADSRIRANGVPYAAFGLLWEQFGTQVLCREDADNFDRDFIQPIDLADNTGEKNMLSLLIADKNPTWQDADGPGQNEAFEKAVAFAKEILVCRFKQIRAERDAYEIVSRKAAQCKDGILYLEHAMPWKAAVKNMDIIYVVYPSIRGGYNIQAVPKQTDEKQLKRPFPEAWRGLDTEGLFRLTGIKDLHFCHKSGFLCAAGTLESAYRTAEMALKSDDSIES